MTKTQTMAYLAGSIDCDGSISVSRNFKARANGSKNLSLVVRVTFVQVNPEGVDFFAKTFGGSVYYYNRKGRAWHQWYVASHNAVRVLKALLPYLVLKRKQAKAALRLQKLITRNRLTGGRPLTAAQHSERFRIADQVKAYNVRRCHNQFKDRHPETVSMPK